MHRPGIPLSIDVIEGGRFAEEISALIRKAEIALIDHVAIYGDRACRAKAVITAKVILQVESTEEDPMEPSRRLGHYVVGSSVELKPPQRPARLAVAYTDVGIDDEPCLMLVTSSGPSQDRQMSLIAAAAAAKE